MFGGWEKFPAATTPRARVRALCADVLAVVALCAVLALMWGFGAL
jgi:hypothetical protein